MIKMTGLLLLAGMLLTGCHQNNDKGATGSTSSEVTESAPSFVVFEDAGALAEALRLAGLPISGIVVYTEETDTNEMLGRPHGYIAKVNFDDDRFQDIKRTDFGTIELFDNSEDLEMRRSYVDEVTKAMPILIPYMYVHKNALLRLNKKLTPTQASEYKKVIENL